VFVTTLFVLIDGGMPVADMKRLLELESLPEEEHYETAAGFMMYMLRKVPRPTDSVEYDGMRFEVLDVDHYRVDQLLVKRIGTRAEPSAAPADSLAGS
jgi:CBS domain containing-hemolysin-like protein